MDYRATSNEIQTVSDIPQGSVLWDHCYSVTVSDMISVAQTDASYSYVYEAKISQQIQKLRDIEYLQQELGALYQLVKD